MAILQTTPVNGTDLIAVDRAATNSILSALLASNSLLFQNLISAASGKVRKYCKRDLVLTDYVELRDGGITPSPEIHLQYPVVSLARLALSPTAVLTVSNTFSVNQRATVATSTTGVTLFWEDSGVSQQDASSVYATYPTLAALAANINGIGSGWQAIVTPGYEQFPSSDLTPFQGAISASQSSATGGAALLMYVEQPGYASMQYFDGMSFTGQPGWYLDAPKGLVWSAGWPRGPQQLRIDYRAGFATIPDEIQEATVLVMIGIYRAGTLNPVLESASLGDASYTYARKNLIISAAVKELLAEYIDYSALHYN